MAKTGRKLLAAATAALALTGCSDGDPTDPGPPPAGTVSFEYAGAHTGSFHAEGTLRLDATGAPEYGTWAAGSREAGRVGILAARAGTEPKADLFGAQLGAVAGEGLVELSALPCLNVSNPAQCRFGLLGLGLDLDDPDAMPDAAYLIIEGTVSVTEFSNDRMSGTFSGTAVDLLAYLADEELETVLTITDGFFDVPILEIGAQIVFEPEPRPISPFAQ